MIPKGYRKKTDVTSITLVNNTAKEELVTVGAGLIWILLGIKAHNIDDVNRVVSIEIYNEAAKTSLLEVLDSETVTATTGRLQWPNSTINVTIESNLFHPVILTAGQTIRVNWATGGASAGGVDADGLVVQYLEKRESE